MHSFSKWQLREYQKGRLKKDAIGGWAWKLPARDPETGAPAPLPKEVQDFVDIDRGRAAGKKNKDKEKTKRKAASESPSENDKEKRKRKAKSESASESEHDTESTGGQIEGLHRHETVHRWSCHVDTESWLQCMECNHESSLDGTSNLFECIAQAPCG